MRRSGSRRFVGLRRVLLAGVVVFVLLQLVPYGWERPNPPVTDPVEWPSERAGALAERACASCHASTTRWPWYAHVAPSSWLVRRDVEVGREELNLSVWDRHDSEADDAAETILEGTMPPLRYRLLHPEARLSEEERQLLVEAFLDLEEAR